MSTRGFPTPFQTLQTNMTCPKLWISWLLRRTQIMTWRTKHMYPHPISDLAYYLQRHRGLHSYCRHLQTMERHHIRRFNLNTTTPASWEIFPWLPLLLGFQAQITRLHPNLYYLNRRARRRGRGAHKSKSRLQTCDVLYKDTFLISFIFNDTGIQNIRLDL